MSSRAIRVVLAAAVLMVAAVAAHAADPRVARGEYLVEVGGCNDCHTPGTFLGHPDLTRYLGGSDVGFAIPGLGVFVAPNLTPDKETGLGTGRHSRSSRHSPPAFGRMDACWRPSCRGGACRT